MLCTEYILWIEFLLFELLRHEIVIYQDDDAVDENSHDACLFASFRHFRDHNVAVNPSKRMFGVRQFDWQGCSVSEHGFRPDPKKCMSFVLFFVLSNIIHVSVQISHKKPVICLTYFHRNHSIGMLTWKNNCGICKLRMENSYRIWFKFIRIWSSLFYYTETREFKDCPSGVSGWYLPSTTWVSNVSVSTFPCRLPLWGWVHGSVPNEWMTQVAHVVMYIISCELML